MQLKKKIATSYVFLYWCTLRHRNPQQPQETRFVNNPAVADYAKNHSIMLCNAKLSTWARVDVSTDHSDASKHLRGMFFCLPILQALEAFKGAREASLGLKFLRQSSALSLPSSLIGARLIAKRLRSSNLLILRARAPHSRIFTARHKFIILCIGNSRSLSPQFS